MSWRTILAAFLVVLSLIGLAGMQYYLLHTRLSVEKWQFDREMRASLYQTRQSLQERSELRTSLKQLYLGEPVEQEAILAPLRQAIQNTLASIEPQPEFTIALYDLTPPKGIILADSTYVVRPEIAGRYRQFLGSRLASECNCRPEVEIQVSSLLLYLIRRQGTIIYSSLVFLVLLLVLLILFIIWLRRLRQLNLRQNDFINHLTHELNTPIFSSKLLLRLLQEANDKGDQKAVARYTNLLRSENDRLAAQSARILELAAWERPKIVLNKSMTDLHALIREETAGFQERITQRAGQLIFHLDAQPSQLYIDPAAWREVLRNLLDNALKYQDDPPEIQIKTQLHKNKLLLEIADRGKGIPPKERKRIFRKFYRLPNRHESGYGLGLTYVHRILKAHGAQIKVSSRQGGGSRIIIQIKSML